MRIHWLMLTAFKGVKIQYIIIYVKICNSARLYYIWHHVYKPVKTCFPFLLLESSEFRWEHFKNRHHFHWKKLLFACQATSQRRVLMDAISESLVFPGRVKIYSVMNILFYAILHLAETLMVELLIKLNLYRFSGGFIHVPPWSLFHTFVVGATSWNACFFQCVIRGSHICVLLTITLQGLQGGLTFVVLSLSAPLHHRCSVVRIR